MNNLQLLQNKVAKTISDRPFHSSATDALEALGWNPGETQTFSSLPLGLCVTKISAHSMDLLANKDVHGYDTSYKDDLRLPRVRRNWGKQKTHYQAVKDMNSLDLCLRNQLTSSLLSIIFIIIFNVVEL